MDFNLGWFWGQVTSNPALLITFVLTLGVIFVNGWTDAPNAIATCVATRCITAKKAVMMSAVCNFFGVLIMTKINAKVAFTIKDMVVFDGADGGTRMSMIALCAAMIAIIVWAVAAWWFGIPTSESHALIAGLSGAAIALQNGIGGINLGEWSKVIIGILLSTFLGFGMGFLFTRIIEFICRKMDRRKTVGFFKGGQIAGGAAMSFMHGAQDGQKFMGVMILGILLANGQNTDAKIDEPPFWMMILVSLVMAFGTSIGGYKIIKSVGMDMVKLEKYQGFAADLAGAGCLLVNTLTGLPVSTTHTKTTAIMGVGASKRLSAINLSVVKEMVLTWILTFPGCGIIGYVMAKILMIVFK